MNLKSDKTHTYTIENINALLLSKLDITAFNSSLSLYYDKLYINSMIANYYNTVYIDNLISLYYAKDQINVITNLLKTDILNT